MKKFFETFGTLKGATISSVVVLVAGISVAWFALGCLYLSIAGNDANQKATIKDLQAEKEELEAEKEKNKAEWQAEKEKLEAENQELEEENREVSAIADAQLDRVLLLPRFYNEDDLPLVGIMEEFSLLGYLADTKDEAKTATINLKAGISKVLLEFSFPKATKKVKLTTPKGEELDMVIRENTIVIPLTKKGIYILKISFKDGDKKYLALNWMGKIKTK